MALISLSLSSLSGPLKINEGVIELPNEHQVPKMITMNFFNDCETQMAFRYNTDYRTDTVLQVVKASEKDFIDKNILEFEGKTEKSLVENDGFIHSVVAKDLEQDTKYLYRLGDKELDCWSEIGSFTTENNQDFTSFIHLSDPQVMEELHSRTYSELLKEITSTKNLDFMCVTGDLVNNSWQDHIPQLNQWEWVLTDQAEYLQNIPMMAVAGNHEASAYDFSSRFNFPIDDLTQDLTSGVYYSYDYHNIHFTCLNTNDTKNSTSLTYATGLSEKQMTWIKQDLEKSKDAQWKVVMMHKGLFDAGSHSSNKEGEDYDIAIMRAQLAPLFSEYKVDLVLQGHDHLYSRSYPITGTFKDNEFVAQTSEEKIAEITFDNHIYHAYPSGPIYVNTGSASGSKYYNVVDYDPEAIPLEKAYGSSNRMVTSYYVNDSTMFANVYEVINGKLSLYDTFAIKKAQSNTDSNSNNFLVIALVTIGVVGILVAIVLIIIKKT